MAGHGLYIGLLRGSSSSHHTPAPTPHRIGRIKRTTATPSRSWRERLRRSIFIASESGEKFSIIVHSPVQGYEGMRMVKLIAPDGTKRIRFVVRKHDLFAKRIKVS